MENNDPAANTAAPKLDNQLCFSLYAAGLAMNKLYRKLLGQLHLTYPQYLVMLVLWEKDHQTVSEIGERLFLDSATLTPLLKRMEIQGLLTRKRSGSDERQVFITLTEQGQQLHQQALAVPKAVFCAVECSLEEIAGIKAQLDKLRSKISQHS